MGRIMQRFWLAFLIFCSATSLFSQESAPTSLKPASTEQALEITFDDLQFEIAKDAKFDRKMLGEKIEALAGKQVKITGYILPTSVYMREGIKTLILQAKDYDHDRAPLLEIYEAIRVEMEEGKTTSFTSQPISVEGEFSIKEWAVINGRPMAIYHLRAKCITPIKDLPAEKKPAK